MADSALHFRPARVADQAAEALRDGIRRGAWEDILPGEFELARRLGIGRTSVRAALAQLAKDGLVEMRQGRRCQIRSQARLRRSGAPTTVYLVTSASRERLGHSRHPSIALLHAQFSDSGVAWEQVFDFSLRGKRARWLAEVMAARQRVCWLLSGVSAPVQRWFEQSGVRALVVGHRYAGIKLPSVDIDYYAVGWHAAGRMAQSGHRRIAFVQPFPVTAGDIACRDGFADYATQAGQKLTVLAISSGASRASLLFRIDRLVRQNPRPTAILSVLPENTLAIYVHLLESGLKIPGDLSLVSGDSNGLLDGALPGLSRYCADLAKQVRRTVRLTHSLMAGNRISLQPSLIMPRFVPGQTLGPPPAGTATD